MLTNNHLIQHIRKKQTRKRKKQPFERTIFTRICTLVKMYDLGECFIEGLEKREYSSDLENLEFSREKAKDTIESPLFALATEKEYRIAMSIIGKVDNLYLQFVHSPEEILLCKPLYRLNPSMDSEKLMKFHFETLYLYECAKAKKTGKTCHKGTKCPDS